MGIFDKLKEKFTKKEEKKVEEVTNIYEEGLEKTRKEFVSSLTLLGKKFTKVNEEYFEALESI